MADSSIVHANIALRWRLNWQVSANSSSALTNEQRF